MSDAEFGEKFIEFNYWFTSHKLDEWKCERDNDKNQDEMLTLFGEDEQ